MSRVVYKIQKKMKKEIIPYILLLPPVILLIFNVFNLSFENLKDTSYLGIFLNLFAIVVIAMVILVDKKNRNKN